MFGFLAQLRELYRLYEQGNLRNLTDEIPALKQNANSLSAQLGTIKTQLDSLQQNVVDSGRRLGEIQDEVVRKSLGINLNIDSKSKHKAFETAYRVIVAGCSPFLVGPAGSGKSTILAQIASAMDLQFYPMSVNSLTSDYNIIGYNDSKGNYVPTIFRQAYEHGGVFSFEEIDAGNPNVLTVVNNAMSQDIYAFPDKIVKKHSKFILAASGNTYGTGATLKYIGRNPLDAATLDRFVMVYTDYDKDLENRLCLNKDWLMWVYQVREIVAKYDMKMVVGTRAVLFGEKLLNVGIPLEAVKQMVVFKGAPRADIDKICGNIR